MMNALDQIVSSTGHSDASSPNTLPWAACLNQSSSTGATPLPELKITSTYPCWQEALPSQCGNVSSVSNPARAKTFITGAYSAGRTKMSKSLVSRWTEV